MASVIAEVAAGELLVLGLLTPLGCAMVISVMLVAGILAHRPNGFFVFKDGYESQHQPSMASQESGVL